MTPSPNTAPPLPADSPRPLTRDEILTAPQVADLLQLPLTTVYHLPAGA
jgi:predicted DNA-binding transcriptional regulator AlpA